MVKSGLNGSHPELAAQRHPTKNGDLAPEQVVDGSLMKAWWICSEGPDYEWEPVIYRRIIGTSCPYCNRGNVGYTVPSKYAFDWTDKKKCTAIFVKCVSCEHESMHLTFAEDPTQWLQYTDRYIFTMDKIVDKFLGWNDDIFRFSCTNFPYTHKE